MHHYACAQHVWADGRPERPWLEAKHVMSEQNWVAVAPQKPPRITSHFLQTPPLARARACLSCTCRPFRPLPLTMAAEGACAKRRRGTCTLLHTHQHSALCSCNGDFPRGRQPAWHARLHPRPQARPRCRVQVRQRHGAPCLVPIPPHPTPVTDYAACCTSTLRASPSSSALSCEWHERCMSPAYTARVRLLFAAGGSSSWAAR